MRESSSDLVYHSFKTFTCAGCGYSFRAPVPCGNRFCAVCGGHRRRRIRSKLKALVSSIHPSLGYKIRFLTLTIPNVEDPRDGIKIIISSFRRLRNRSFWRNKVAGGAFVIECTGHPGSWHVHLHALLETRYIPVRLLSKHWRKVSPGRIVYLTNVPTNACINYLTKYLAKSEAPLAHQLILSEAFAGSRMFNVFGSWFALSLAIKPIKYACPKCEYTGFYYNPEELAYEQYGRPPPNGTHARFNRDRLIERVGTPTCAQFAIISH